jgi:hypothetical protein
MSKETAEDRELRAELEGIGLAEGGRMVGSVPERWLSQPRFRCINFHVSSRFTVHRRSHRLCVFCDLPVQPTFPEDRSGPLSAPERSTGLLPQQSAPGVESYSNAEIQ